MANQEETRKSTLVIILTHTAVALCVTVIVLALTSLFVSGGAIPVSAMLPLSVFAVFAGVLTGGFRAARKHKSHRMPIGGAVGAASFLFQFFVGMMFAFPPAKHTLSILLAALAGGLLGGFLSAPRAKKHHR